MADAARPGLGSVQEIIAFAGECARVMETPMFRGQPGVGLPLIPKLYRYDSSPRAERMISERFRLFAPSRARACPDYDDWAGWLLLMQHYGVPTRLLDWTNSALVAAFFACQEDSEADGEVFALSPRALHASVGIAVGPSSLLALSFILEDCFYSKERDRPGAKEIRPQARMATEIIAVGGSEIDLRLLVQQAMFTVHPPGRTTLAVPDDPRSKMLRAARVAGSAKRAILQELRHAGVTRTFLFPDLPVLGEEIFQRHVDGYFMGELEKGAAPRKK